jgi:hypothetical protein
MENELDNIRDISPVKSEWRIRAQITWLWVIPSYKDPSLSSVIKMVLLDSHVCFCSIYVKTISFTFCKSFIKLLVAPFHL